MPWSKGLMKLGYICPGKVFNEYHHTQDVGFLFFPVFYREMYFVYQESNFFAIK